MHPALRPRASLILLTVLISPACMAGVPGTPLTALDDQALTQVHGAGLDTDLLKQWQQSANGEPAQRQPERDEQGRRALSAQQNAALLAAMALQAKAAPQAATLAVNAVSAGSQLGGTLIALTPVTALAPIGLPLFGLPSLPSRHSNR